MTLDGGREIKTFTLEQLNELSEQARQSPRRRANFNLHNELNDPIQRFYNAMEPSTYVRPHRHPQQGKWELFQLMRGKALVVIFNSNGQMTKRYTLAGDEHLSIEIPENTWHTVVSLEHDTILYESKPGPYIPLDDKDFADWAPQENTEQTSLFIDWFIHGELDSNPPELKHV